MPTLISLSGIIKGLGSHAPVLSSGHASSFFCLFFLQSGLDRLKQLPYEFTFTWDLKNKVNEQTNQKHTHR